MGKSQREKGKRGERELAGHLRDYGYNCRQYCGRSGAADVVGLPGIHIECKRVERLNLHDAMERAVRDAGALPEDGRPFPAVFHRRDHEEWLVTMRLEEWIHLYREWESGRELG